MIFVFGSNKMGIHRAGAAKYALEYFGAIMGQAEGHQGNSYALPTKQTPKVPLSLPAITENIERFMSYANKRHMKQFKVTKIACGLAGYHDYQIASLFRKAPNNCYFDMDWMPYLGEDKKYWGTYD